MSYGVEPPGKREPAMRTSLILIAAFATIAAKPPFIQLTSGGNDRFSANLTGKSEVPRGDRDGGGYASIRTKPGQNRICYDLSVHRVRGVTMAHVHRGRMGENGPPVLTLSAPYAGQSSGCKKASSSLIRDINRNPSRFYVNVHSMQFPNGAIRGQLRR
jgi:hypothetical protein